MNNAQCRMIEVNKNEWIEEDLIGNLPNPVGMKILNSAEEMAEIKALQERILRECNGDVSKFAKAIDSVTGCEITKEGLRLTIISRY